MCFERCLRCHNISEAPMDKAIAVCLPCNRQDEERARARETLARVQRESSNGWMLLARCPIGKEKALCFWAGTNDIMLASRSW